MSRSYRKPCVTDNRRGSHKAKKTASRRLRRGHNQDFGGGNEYKKHFETWDIHDQKWVYHKDFKHSDCKQYYESEEEYNQQVKKYSRK